MFSEKLPVLFMAHKQVPTKDIKDHYLLKNSVVQRLIMMPFFRHPVRNPWSILLAAFLFSRIIVFGGFLLADNPVISDFAEKTYLYVIHEQKMEKRPEMNTLLNSNGILERILLISMRCDGAFYYEIATQGYGYNGRMEYQTSAFYPLLGWVSAAISMVPVALGAPQIQAIFWCGIILNNLLFLLAVFLAFKLVRQFSGEHVALITGLLLCFYPGSFFCSQFMTESLFLAFSLLFLMSLEDKRYYFAGFWSVAANLTRANGIIFPLLYLCYLPFQGFWRCRKSYLFAFGVVLLSVFMIPLYFGFLFHNPWLYFNLQSKFRGIPSPSRNLMLILLFGLTVLVSLIAQQFKTSWLNSPYPALIKSHLGLIDSLLVAGSVVFFASFALIPPFAGPLSWITEFESLGLYTSLLSIVLIGLGLFSIPKKYTLFVLLNLIMMLKAHMFHGNFRYLVTVFPLFWCLAIALRPLPKMRITVYSFWALMLFILSLLHVFDPI